MGVLDELTWTMREQAGGDDVAAIPEPGLDAATIDAVERRLGVPLPADLRTLLGVCHEWSIIDMRASTPGMGFSWGRCEYPAGLRRHGQERLFACAAPKRRTGILSRFFGR